MEASKIYFHLFALVSLSGMTLWIVKDLWPVMLALLVLGVLVTLVGNRRKR